MPIGVLSSYIRKESERKVLNDLNDLDLNDRFSRFFGYLQCVFSFFAIFLQ